MAVYREAPQCQICGDEYQGIYADRGETFVGDTFVQWDISGHTCNRDGLIYFIERKDTHQWLAPLNTWTNDPLTAKIWRDKTEAIGWLNDKKWHAELGFYFPDSEVTEHLFDSYQIKKG